MCRGAWIKFFNDGTNELGTDFQVDHGEASWSKGRLDNINEVQITNKNVLSSLSVPNTNWHQFDHFIVSTDNMKPERLFRVLQAEILPEHVDMSLMKKWIGVFMFWVSVQNEDNINIIKITEDMVGQWLTLILPKGTDPYLTLSERGKF